MSKEITKANKTQKAVTNKKRWFAYALVGIFFGIFDFYYQHIEFGTSSLVRVLAILGIWLVPLVPIALYEARISRSILKPALASIFTWSIAIIAYYVYLLVKVVFIGQASRPEVHISSISDPYYWGNLRTVFLGDVGGGIVEWIGLAIVGGGILGLLVGFAYKLGIRLRHVEKLND